MSTDWDEYRWLAAAEGQSALEELANLAEPLESLVPKLRKRYSPGIAHRLVEQFDLRRRAGEKFSRPERMLFTPLGLEQATDEWVARYKASRFPPGAAVADLCCGMGGDLLGLGSRGPAVGVDCEPLTAWLARHNSQQETVAADVADFDVARFAGWHVDPDRRPGGRRTTRVVDHQPGLDALERLMAANPHAAIKLAPAAEWPEDWNQRAEFEWISRDGQCRQLVAWFGGLARSGGMRSAVILDRQGHVLESVTGPHEPCEPARGEIGRWLFEPDAAVIAAGLTGALSDRLELSQPTPGIAYLTGDSPRQTAALAAFEVMESLPFDLKRLRAWFRDRHAECIEVKKRGVAIEPARVLRELRNTGGERLTLLVFPVAERVVAVIARRITAT